MLHIENPEHEWISRFTHSVPKYQNAKVSLVEDNPSFLFSSTFTVNASSYKAFEVSGRSQGDLMITCDFSVGHELQVSSFSLLWSCGHIPPPLSNTALHTRLNADHRVLDCVRVNVMVKPARIITWCVRVSLQKWTGEYLQHWGCHVTVPLPVIGSLASCLITSHLKRKKEEAAKDEQGSSLNTGCGAERSLLCKKKFSPNFQKSEQRGWTLNIHRNKKWRLFSLVVTLPSGCRRLCKHLVTV